MWSISTVLRCHIAFNFFTIIGFFNCCRDVSFNIGKHFEYSLYSFVIFTQFTLYLQFQVNSILFDPFIQLPAASLDQANNQIHNLRPFLSL